MYRLRRIIRFILILILLAAVIGGVSYYIITHDYADRVRKYQINLTVGVETAVGNALFDATRTMESDEPHYRLISVPPSETLESVAAQYDTTVDVIRMANALAITVDTGNGTPLIVPQGVKQLDPPRRFVTITAGPGDTLAGIAAHNNVPIEVINADNPILAQRGVIPGDIVFVAQLL